LQNLRLLSMQSSQHTIHISDDDMIHITWKHVTLCINPTGLIYLLDFLDGSPCFRNIGFEAYGNMDDGFEIWIENVGLRLSTDDCIKFKQLLTDGLNTLRSSSQPTSITQK